MCGQIRLALAEVSRRISLAGLRDEAEAHQRPTIRGTDAGAPPPPPPSAPPLFFCTVSLVLLHSRAMACVSTNPDLK